MKKLLLCCAVVFSLACVAKAGVLPTPSYQSTFGSNEYSGHIFGLGLDLPLGFSAQANYGFYTWGRSTDTYQSVFLKAGWQGDLGSFYVKGSFTPQSQGYKSSGMGADASVRLWQWDDPLPVSLHALAGYNRVQHTDGETAPGRSNDIVENDYAGGAVVQLFQTRLTAKLTRMQYDNLQFRSVRILQSETWENYQPGYPSQALDVTVEQNITSLIYVYGSYGNTQYKFGPNTFSQAYGAGMGLDLPLIDVSVQYTRNVPQGSPPEDFYSFHISVF